MRPAVIGGWRGIGDAIYLRPAVRAQSAHRAVYLETAWPELFDDLPVKFVRREMALRTQRKNIESLPRETWSELPVDAERIRPRQTWAFGSIPGSIRESVPFLGEPFVFDLPPAGPSPVQSEKPIAVIRPVTLRREWLNPARAPAPEYVAAASEHLRTAGFHVVSVADVDGEAEWIEGPEPVADEVFHKGDLSLGNLMALVNSAAVVVGGVGFIVPMCIAYGTPLVVICGGCGRSNNPEWLTAGLDTSRVRWLVPDEYCMCSREDHDCPKAISDFDVRFLAALAGAIR